MCYGSLWISSGPVITRPGSTRCNTTATKVGHRSEFELKTHPIPGPREELSDVYRANAQIPRCICPISHKVQFRTEMWTFLFWMMHCGLWDRCMVEFVRLAYCTSFGGKASYYNRAVLYIEKGHMIDGVIIHFINYRIFQHKGLGR